MILLAALGIVALARPACAEPATITWDDSVDEEDDSNPVPQQTPSAADKLKADFFHQAVKNLPPEKAAPNTGSGRGLQTLPPNEAGSGEQSGHLRPSPWKENK